MAERQGGRGARRGASGATCAAERACSPAHGAWLENTPFVTSKASNPNEPRVHSIQGKHPCNGPGKRANSTDKPAHGVSLKNASLASSDATDLNRMARFMKAATSATAGASAADGFGNFSSTILSAR